MASLAFAADGDKSSVKGLITGIDGTTVTVRDGNNVDHRFVLTPSTEIKKREGVAALRFEHVEASALMAGLPITADLVEQGGQQQALAISFRSDDFRTAQQVQAGLSPTSTRVDANAQGVGANAQNINAMDKRMNEFGTYEALATAEVLFASGSATIDAKGRSALTAFAQQAKQTPDYLVVLQGFTDSTGNPAVNQKLSEARANAVADFLQEQAGLMPGRVQSPDGMGVSPDAGSGNNANARKVVVKLIVDKGVQDR